MSLNGWGKEKNVGVRWKFEEGGEVGVGGWTAAGGGALCC